MFINEQKRDADNLAEVQEIRNLITGKLSVCSLLLLLSILAPLAPPLTPRAPLSPLAPLIPLAPLAPLSPLIVFFFCLFLFCVAHTFYRSS